MAEQASPDDFKTSQEYLDWVNGDGCQHSSSDRFDGTGSHTTESVDGSFHDWSFDARNYQPEKHTLSFTHSRVEKHSADGSCSGQIETWICNQSQVGEKPYPWFAFMQVRDFIEDSTHSYFINHTIANTTLAQAAYGKLEEFTEKSIQEFLTTLSTSRFPLLPISEEQRKRLLEGDNDLILSLLESSLTEKFSSPPSHKRNFQTQEEDASAEAEHISEESLGIHDQFRNYPQDYLPATMRAAEQDIRDGKYIDQYNPGGLQHLSPCMALQVLESSGFASLILSPYDAHRGAAIYFVADPEHFPSKEQGAKILQTAAYEISNSSEEKRNAILLELAEHPGVTFHVRCESFFSEQFDPLNQACNKAYPRCKPLGLTFALTSQNLNNFFNEYRYKGISLNGEIDGFKVDRSHYTFDTLEFWLSNDNSIEVVLRNSTGRTTAEGTSEKDGKLIFSLGATNTFSSRMEECAEVVKSFSSAPDQAALKLLEMADSVDMSGLPFQGNLTREKILGYIHATKLMSLDAQARRLNPVEHCRTNDTVNALNTGHLEVTLKGSNNSELRILSLGSNTIEITLSTKGRFFTAGSSSVYSYSKKGAKSLDLEALVSKFAKYSSIPFLGARVKKQIQKLLGQGNPIINHEPYSTKASQAAEKPKKPHPSN